MAQGCRIPWLLLPRSSGQFGHCASDVGCCSYHCEWLRSDHHLSRCWARPAMGVVKEETGRWGRATSQLGRQELLSSVLSLHALSLYEETQPCCMHWLVTGRRWSLAPPGEPSPRDPWGDACVSPTLPAQGWEGYEFRGWLCWELQWSSSWRCVLGNADLKPQNMFRGKLLAKRLYIEQGGCNKMELVVWTNLTPLRTVYKSGRWAVLELSSSCLLKSGKSLAEISV